MKISYEPLRIERYRQKLTLRQLSEKSGVSMGHLSAVINGDADLTVSKLMAVAAALNVPPSQLYEKERGNENTGN